VQFPPWPRQVHPLFQLRQMLPQGISSILYSLLISLYIYIYTYICISVLSLFFICKLSSAGMVVFSNSNLCFSFADFQAQEWWSQQARPWPRQVHPLFQLRQMLPQGISSIPYPLLHQFIYIYIYMCVYICFVIVSISDVCLLNMYVNIIFLYFYNVDVVCMSMSALMGNGQIMCLLY
jgi:hypothetical protein